jgi:hypothetical protein
VSWRDAIAPGAASCMILKRLPLEAWS